MFIRQLPSAAKNILILVTGVFSLWGIYLLAGVIAPFLFSIVVAYILNPIVRLLESRKIPRPWAVLTLFIVGILIGVLVLVPLGLNIASQIHDLVVKLSTLDVKKLTNEYKIAANTLYERYSQIPWVKNYLETLVVSEKLHELAAQAVVVLKDLTINVIQKVFSVLISAFSGVLGVFLIPLFTFYILVDLDLFYKNTILLIPPVYRDSVIRIFNDIDTLLGSLLRGQLISAIIFASLMSCGLWISGLNFALLLGPIAGIANLIPYLGGLVTIVLSALTALSQFGPSNELVVTLIKVFATLAVIQTFDGFFLQPKVIGENVGLHPVAIMLALIIGGRVFGFLGMLVAVPVTCILKVVSRELYHELYDPT